MAALLIGWFKAACHGKTCFSTYHKVSDGKCEWCGKTEAELLKLGAEWVGRSHE